MRRLWHAPPLMKESLDQPGRRELGEAFLAVVMDVGERVRGLELVAQLAQELVGVPLGVVED